MLCRDCFMPRKESLAVFAMMSIMIAFPNAANAAGCQLDGTELNCATSGSSAEEIAKAFASPETRNTLASPLSEVSRFQENGSVENFRRSLEANWRTITRYSRNRERSRNAGRLSAADFGNWQRQFEQAEESYDTAIRFYRYLHWQGLK